MNFPYLSRAASFFSCILVASVLAGCAGAPTQRMSVADRATIKTVTVNPEVQMPQAMFFHGQAQSAAAVGGLVGALVGAEMAKGPSEQIVAKLKEKQIVLPEIVKSEFQRAAAASGALAFADNAASADGELTFAVNVYGFGQTQGFSPLLYPLMNVSATLKKKDGSIAWQKTEFATPHNSENTLGHKFDEYMANPELLRATLTNMSGILSRLLVKDLRTE
jgi:hypothetical protein